MPPLIQSYTLPKVQGRPGLPIPTAQAGEVSARIWAPSSCLSQTHTAILLSPTGSGGQPPSQHPSSPTPYCEARERSTHALFSEPFQGSLLPLATNLNSPPPCKAHPGSSGASGQPHLLPGLTPPSALVLIMPPLGTRYFLSRIPSSPAPVHLSNSYPLSKMQPKFSPVLPLPNSPGPPCSVLLSTQYPLVS